MYVCMYVIFIRCDKDAQQNKHTKKLSYRRGTPRDASYHNHAVS